MAFEGKVILITGASNGFGAACAEYFSEQGALLSLVGRNAEKFEKVIENIKALGVENEPLIILADVTVDYKRIIDETIEKYQRLDILINNAGALVFGTIETLTAEGFDEMFSLNVRGLFLLTQLAIPHLAESKGNIVNVSSVAGMRPLSNFVGYCMSKAAVDIFTRCTALELAEKRIRVNSVNPGVVATGIHLTAGVDPNDYPEMLETMGKMHALGRCGESNEIVHAIAFLANEKSSFITGACLLVDGGLSVKGPFS